MDPPSHFTDRASAVRLMTCQADQVIDLTPLPREIAIRRWLSRRMPRSDRPSAPLEFMARTHIGGTTHTAGTHIVMRSPESNFSRSIESMWRSAFAQRKFSTLHAKHKKAVQTNVSDRSPYRPAWNCKDRPTTQLPLASSPTIPTARVSCRRRREPGFYELFIAGSVLEKKTLAEGLSS
jgi:hypothetical protein